MEYHMISTLDSSNRYHCKLKVEELHYSPQLAWCSSVHNVHTQCSVYRFLLNILKAEKTYSHSLNECFFTPFSIEENRQMHVCPTYVTEILSGMGVSQCIQDIYKSIVQISMLSWYSYSLEDSDLHGSGLRGQRHGILTARRSFGLSGGRTRDHAAIRYFCSRGRAELIPLIFILSSLNLPPLYFAFMAMVRC